MATALIIGAGSGLSAALARAAARDGLDVVLAARDIDKLRDLARETGARTIACSAERPDSVAALFAALPAPDLVVYNASYRSRGPLVELDPAEVLQTLMVTCYGGFLVGQAAARAMLPGGRGTILFTGASASVKGYAQSAPFAMGKFGLRGLAQSMARELGPKGIHVAHVVIDGGIARAGDPRAGSRGPDGMLDADAIAAAYMHLHRQPRSTWSFEIDVRPWVETF